MNEETTTPIIPAPKPNILADLWGKVPQKIRDTLSRFSKSAFYSNKKVFWPVTIIFGLLFLVIILGLLFGKKGEIPATSKNTPTPSSQDLNKLMIDDGSPLFKIGQKLIDLKTQISSFDPQQSRLKPPTLNFDVKF